VARNRRVLSTPNDGFTNGQYSANRHFAGRSGFPCQPQRLAHQSLVEIH
jgi:hypothetical protein